MVYDDDAISVFLADCPARQTVELLSEKWSVVVLAGLSDRPVRHKDLAERIGGISRKMLTETLRRLQLYGLVARTSFAESPQRVEYQLTTLGASLIPLVKALAEWARVHGTDVLAALDSAAGAESALASKDH